MVWIKKPNYNDNCLFFSLISQSAIQATPGLNLHHERCYVGGGHSRSHEPHREEHGFRNAKKVRKGEGGQSFSGEVSLVPREEEWMIEGEERSQQGGQAKKLFCYAGKGGKTPVRVEEGNELSLSEDEEVEIEVMEEERNRDKPTEKKQGPEIRCDTVRMQFGKVLAKERLGYSSAVKLEIEKFDGRINFGLWQIQVKDVLIQSEDKKYPHGIAALPWIRISCGNWVHNCTWALVGVEMQARFRSIPRRNAWSGLIPSEYTFMEEYDSSLNYDCRYRQWQQRIDYGS
ncbi:uncharacterized protein DS421_3g78060 [Arachis hypogaea]|nr:uncharacterized protein DS421_3g78060 [Arachis hypogaea]